MAESPARRVAATSMADRTAELLRDDILAGSIPPGESITEPLLAERFGISRTPVREAVAQLEAEGLVVRRNRRIVVVELSVQDALDIYMVRVPLEVVAAEQVAKRRNDEIIGELERSIVVARYDAEHDDWRGVARAARAFHNAMFDSSGNPVLARTLRQLHDRIDHYRIFRRDGRNVRLSQSLQEHELIVAAIKSGDARAAGREMRKHLEAARDHLARSYDG